MTERVKAWQCIGCGRLENSATCLGICQDVPVTLVAAADYDALRRELDELRFFLLQLVHSTPRSGNWERSYRAAQDRARALLEERKPATLAA